jgi:hypothetical protein
MEKFADSFTWTQDYTFLANMSGSQEIPGVTTNGLGLASIHYTRGTLSLEISTRNYPACGQCYHGSSFCIQVAPDANGPVIVDLSSLIDGNIIRGTIEVTLQKSH